MMSIHASPTPADHDDEDGVCVNGTVITDVTIDESARWGVKYDYYLSQLTNEYQDWCGANGLDEEGDALDKLCDEHLTDAQRTWLSDFYRRWTKLCRMQEEAFGGKAGEILNEALAEDAREGSEFHDLDAWSNYFWEDWKVAPQAVADAWELYLKHHGRL